MKLRSFALQTAGLQPAPAAANAAPARGIVRKLVLAAATAATATVRTCAASGAPLVAIFAPNPTATMNFMFQVQPSTFPSSQCPAGQSCCNNLTVQSGHSALNVALCDGSLHGVAPTLSSSTWMYAMLPNDRQTLGTDW